jgi:hypothetical protein
MERLNEILTNFIETEKWTYAKTMPEWPHEYIVRERVDEALFVELVLHIRKHGYEGKFYSRTMVYFDQDGYTYWTMGSPLEETIIINRTQSENSYEQRLKNGTLPNPNNK